MQSHVDVKVPTVAEYGSALEQFLAAGYEIQITELDFTINFDTEGTNASLRLHRSMKPMQIRQNS